MALESTKGQPESSSTASKSRKAQKNPNCGGEGGGAWSRQALLLRWGVDE